MRGEDAMVSFEEFETDRRIGCVCSAKTESIVRRLQNDRGGRVNGCARRVGDAADAMRPGDGRDALNQFRKRHGNAVDGDGQSGAKAISRRAGASG
jgi:hypothetical protein